MMGSKMFVARDRSLSLNFIVCIDGMRLVAKIDMCNDFPHCKVDIYSWSTDQGTNLARN